MTFLSRHSIALRGCRVAGAILFLLLAGVSIGHAGDEPEAKLKGQLSVVLQASVLSIELDVPSADIVGFAHPPKTAAQWKAMHAGSEKLLAGASMFVLPGAAECRFLGVKIENPFGPKAEVGEREQPAFGARYYYSCRHAKWLSHIDLRYFERFPSARTLNATFHKSHKPRRQHLTPRKTRLRI